MKRPICGSCPDCLDVTNRLAQPRRVPTLDGPRPTAEQLERHGARFGWAQVPETAAQLGITITVPKGAQDYPHQRPAWRRRH